MQIKVFPKKHAKSLKGLCYFCTAEFNTWRHVGKKKSVILK